MSVPKVPPALKSLVRLLSRRKQSTGHPHTIDRPYHVLLTSALSLTPTLRRSICGSDNWSRFSHYLRTLNTHDRQLALSPLQYFSTYSEGHRALARLMVQGYFSVVLTAAIDSQMEDALEDALAEQGLPRRAFELLIAERDSDEDIAQKLQEDSKHLCIVKLHGGLREGRISPTYPDFLELRPRLADGIKHVLNQDILIIGSIEHDHDINKVFNTRSDGNIYYAVQRLEKLHDDIIRIVQAREQHIQRSVITGIYSHFDTLLCTLEQQLSAGVPDTPAHSVRNAAHLHEDRSSEVQEPLSRPFQAMPPAAVLRADILLVTVTEVETQAVFDAVKEQLGREYQRHAPGDKTYYDLGLINDARVCLVESAMGSSTSDGSLLTVSDGVQLLKPSAVIMVGIAFGLLPKGQRLGDILVSQHVRNYEPQRYGATDQLFRGIPIPASKRLLDRFKSGAKDWQGPQVHLGLMLSGEKLVDNLVLRNQLHALEPEAIGGDMEGAGLSVAAQHHNTHWILVKAICDWADGDKSRNKKQRQKQAARNAARFTLHVLLKMPFIPSSNE